MFCGYIDEGEYSAANILLTSNLLSARLVQQFVDQMAKHRVTHEGTLDTALATVQVGTQRRSQLLSALALLVQTTTALASGGLATVGSSTVGSLAVGPGEYTELLVVDDGRVVGVDHDDLVVLVLAILADPVGVEDFQVGEVAVDTLFSDALRVLGHGDLGDTGLGRLALHVNLALAKSTTANAGADENNALLGLVAHAAGSVETGWALDAAVDRFTAPLSHALLAVHVGQCVFWTSPGVSNVLVQSLCHDVHLCFSASCRPISPL